MLDKRVQVLLQVLEFRVQVRVDSSQQFPALAVFPAVFLAIASFFRVRFYGRTGFYTSSRQYGKLRFGPH